MRFFYILILFSGSILAGETDKPLPDGKQIYDKHCMGCHDTRIHTRPNRIVHVYTDLANRVKFCDAQLKSNFNDAQLKAVTEYLNTSFYKFIKE